MTLVLTEITRLALHFEKFILFRCSIGKYIIDVYNTKIKVFKIIQDELMIYKCDFKPIVEYNFYLSY